MSARAINAPPAERIAYSRYARPKHRDKPLTRLKIVPVPEVQTFGWLGQHARICAFLILLCLLACIGVAAARGLDYLGRRAISGIEYCSHDPMDDFRMCGDEACFHDAVVEMGRHTRICYPEAVASLT